MSDNPYNNANIKISQTLTSSDISIDVIEYDTLTASTPEEAMSFFYMNKANIKLRQCVIKLTGKTGIQLSAGAMSVIHGPIEMTSNVKGVGDFFGKVIKSAVTKEQAIKPLYKGTGRVWLAPTLKFHK